MAEMPSSSLPPSLPEARMAQSRPADPPSAQTRRKVVMASFIGNFVEWFDYAAYGYLAAVISTVFFPEADKTTALLATFAVFAISFLVRPLGGVVWGHIGDKVGRKAALSLSILIMTKVQPILTRNTEIHESVHAHHVADLKKQYGKGYKAVFNDAGDWVRDEINARKAEIVFLTKVVAALKTLETMVK